MRHLTDDEIQTYLDGGAPARSTRVADHLRECLVCRVPLEEYRSLYGALADEECFAPSFHKATQALSEVRLRERSNTWRDHTETAVATLGIAAALAVALWTYVSLGWRGVDFARASAVLERYISPALESLLALSSSTASLGDEVGFVVTACFVLYVVFSLDYLLLRPSAGQEANGWS